MNKIVCWLLCLVCMFSCVCTAAAEATLLTVTTDASATAVSLLDEDGQSVSSILDHKNTAQGITWTLNIQKTNAQSVALYTKDASGNWLNTGVVYDMGWFFPDGGASDAAAPTEAPQDEAPWPTLSFDTTSVYAYDLPSDERIQSRCGPARTYHGGGGYKTYKIQDTQALFIENGYLFVDLTYQTVPRRRLYFATDLFSGWNNVEKMSFSAYAARTTTALTPLFGPGGQYDTFDEAAIASATSLSVYFEEDGYVFAEFECELGPVRAWIPVDSVVSQ